MIHLPIKELKKVIPYTMMKIMPALRNIKSVHAEVSADRANILCEG